MLKKCLIFLGIKIFLDFFKLGIFKKGNILKWEYIFKLYFFIEKKRNIRILFFYEISLCEG